MISLTYKAKNGVKAVRRWVIPYFMSRFYSKRFRPLLSYLFTEYQCNIDCHYCFQHDEKREGMSLKTAKQSIDWLRSIGCRVVAIMGGEPLLRRDFIVKVIEYGAKRGFFMYLPTNGYLMTRDFIDRIGKAGVAAVNVAVDAISYKPGLPKALMTIEPQLRYLIQQQKKYGYIIFFNINITSKNMKDARLLTEIAHDNGIGTDYHVNEEPLMDHSHYSHKGEDFYIKPQHYKEFGELIDWIIMKQKKGYPMVNSIKHLEEMKKFVQGKHNHRWDCRAGHNGCFIRPDGSIAPCFEMFDAKHDWGTIWNPKFDPAQLNKMKKECRKRCLSTCYSTMASYYNLSNIMEWVRKHTLVG